MVTLYGNTLWQNLMAKPNGNTLWQHLMATLNGNT